MGCGDHPACRAAHFPEAHLGEEVEIVFVQQDYLRLQGVQPPLVLAEILCQHGIEQRHLVPDPP
jgi:hypothetical protein